MLPIRARRNHKRLLWFVVAVLMILIATAFVVIFFNQSVHTPEQKTVTSKSEVVSKPVAISSNMLFMGDVFWGRYINDWSQASSLKTSYPFSRLSEFNRMKYDAWIADLECPSVNGVNMTSAQEDATLTFNCSPDYLPEAAKWFTIFGNANNHSDNQGGMAGLIETRQHLEQNKIQYFGNFDPEVLKDVCEVTAMPVTISLDDKTTKKGSLPVAMCGYHGVFKIPSAASLAVMQAYAKVMPVIAFPHSGQEYKTGPDQIKTDLYRSMIDNGADMVIGDHAHWIQNSESYKGHLIVYSMGNFIFDQQDTPEVVRSAAINVNMKLAANADTSQLDAWLRIGSRCVAFQDDCMAQIASQGLKKLQVTYGFGVVGSNDSGKIVKPATPDQQEAILQRLNWQKTMTQLQAPYSSL
ncbi:MAG: CapA family protein [Candidatus Saccharimonadales bacterium]